MCNPLEVTRCTVTYDKSPLGVRFTVPAYSLSREFTVSELEHALEIAKKPVEKPIFNATTTVGSTIFFQKQGEFIYCRGNAWNLWRKINEIHIEYFSNSELEAIIKARNS